MVTHRKNTIVNTFWATMTDSYNTVTLSTMTKGLQNDFPNEPLAFLDQKGLSVGKTSFFFHQHQPPTTTMNCIIPKEGKSGRPQQATQS
jgi:hypothetical protein